MMKAYERTRMSSEVAGMFRSMIAEGVVVLNGPLWTSTAKSLSPLFKTLECTPSAERFRRHDVCSTASLNVVAWNAMITGQNGRSNEIIAMFHSMREAGVHPDRITLCSTAVGALELGAELDSRTHVSKDMPSKNEASWNALICGVAFNGRGHDAIQQFELMRNEEGLRPDEITFIGALSACVHTGLLECGHRLFNSLTLVFKITPRIEHYSCMIDLMSRAGHLEFPARKM
ncbi:hypothetical protein EJB05_34803, partial [Eragrostis curvula]